jgi:hypothetical protein
MAMKNALAEKNTATQMRAINLVTIGLPGEQ